MGISGIGSAVSAQVNQTASDGDSATAAASGSGATKLAETQNGGTAAGKTAAQSSSNSSDLAKLKRLANQNMSATAIAQQLGKSVSTIVQEAAAAGIKINSGNSSSTAGANPDVGQNVDTMA